MIHVQGLKKTYGEKVVLDDVNFVISENQKIGLIGPNGTGKTTIFKILLDLEEPDSGSVSKTGEYIGYLPQVISYKNEDTIFSYLKSVLKEDWEEYKIDMTLATVGLEIIDRHMKMDKLSGGQKTKIALAKLLIDEPTMLLMDEPTNNLDLESMVWLERFVKNFKGNVLVISHDRAFLDNTVKKIFELDPHTHTLNEYHGGYSDFVIEKAQRYEKAMDEFKRHEEKRKKMEAWIAEKKQQLAVHANPKVGRQLQAMKTRYQREVVEVAVEKPKDYKKISISGFGEESYKKRIIYYIEDLKHPVISVHKLSITGGNRIHLQGKNGSGKTTFIKILLNEYKPTEGQITKGTGINIGYFAQEHESLNPKKSVIEEFMQQTNIGDEQRSRKILGKFLFQGSQVFTKIASLSQGEKVKLMMAILTHNNNQFLILDEPTNHLDIESREILESALKEYEGGFIVISHDRFFIHQININKVLKAENGKLFEDKILI